MTAPQFFSLSYRQTCYLFFHRHDLVRLVRLPQVGHMLPRYRGSEDTL